MAEHDHCHSDSKQEHQHHGGCHDRSRPDYLLWVSMLGVIGLYLHYWLWPESAGFAEWYQTLSSSVFDLMNTIWWGIVLGILMVSALSRVPRDFVMSILGTHSGFRGILRATAAGVLLDLCSHGILMVGAKIYERGATTGQVMAFLVASPWNSFSFTLVLFALVGIGWTLAFIGLSMVIAVVVGSLFDLLIARGHLPKNPNETSLPKDFRFWPELKRRWSWSRFTPAFVRGMMWDGLKESRMVVRWILFGVLLAGLVRAFMNPETFAEFFGPTLAGLGLTMLVATIMEVCSEGSAPIAGDLLNRAKAPGNAFAFLMTGVATDYTEIMVLKDATRSWKVPLFLPLLSVPQVLLIAWAINQLAV
ncbi:MAG: permease [Pseudomonadota bacterium]